MGDQDVHVHYYVINHKKEKLELSFGNDYENVNSFKAMAEISGAKVVTNTGMTIAGARKFFMDKMELLDVLNLDGSGSSQMYYNGDFVAQSSDDTLHGDVYVRAIGNILKVSNK